MTRLEYNYHILIRNILKYLPAKITIILCSFLLIPIFTLILDTKDISIYLIGIQLLNLFCTFSSDWIAKGVLRFYTKYKIDNRIIEFFSTIFFLSCLVYAIILVLFFILKDIIYSNLVIPNSIFALVILLILPTGIRQVLYQLVRIKNKAILYTMSIIFYHTIFIAIFLLLVKYYQSALSIILAMILAMICVDCFLIKSLGIKKCNLVKPQKDIILNFLKYALPLIITNVLYWLLLNFSLLIYQNSKNYIYSASLSISMTISNLTITSIAALFLFVAFPIFIKNFESKKNIKQYYTNLIQLYLLILLPLVGTFCLFAKDFVSLFLPEQYSIVATIIPFLTTTYFMHEFLKMINIKYHLKNKTYLEMLINGIFIITSLFLLPLIIQKFDLLGILWLLLITELLLFIINILLKLKNIDYINYFLVLKTFIYIIGIITVSYFLIMSINFPLNQTFAIIKISLFIILTYSLNYLLRAHILY